MREFWKEIFWSKRSCFRYATVKPALFFGYKILYVDGHGIKMAEPEKALLDFLYFHPKAREEADFASYRFNLAQMRIDLDVEKLDAYGTLFASSALTKRLATCLLGFRLG